MACLVSAHDMWPGIRGPVFFDEVRQRLVDERLDLAAFVLCDVAQVGQKVCIDLGCKFSRVTPIGSFRFMPNSCIFLYHETSRNRNVNDTREFECQFPGYENGSSGDIKEQGSTGRKTSACRLTKNL